MDFVLIALLGMIISLGLGYILIPLLRRLKFGQTVRDDGPKTHLEKTGTPTMGGLMFLIPILIVGGVISIFRPEIIPVIASGLIFGLVGFIDDFLKVVKKHKNGLSILHKTIIILAFSLAFSVYTSMFTNIGIDIWLPVIGTVKSQVFYMIFVVVYFFGTTNAVNFADGLDGLLAGLIIIVMAFVAVFSYENSASWHGYGLIAALAIGCCTGFIFFNVHPAKVFMGDTGSLALGGMFAALLLMMKSPLLIFIVGAIFVIEGLSVAIQVFSFKTTGKRIFKMAPIHHHFELLGWTETRVVAVFWSFCVLTSIFGFLIVHRW
ncbi:MAG: phospho-N-acetylmuramoyl-pentapeptide-transferase [Bacillota bacterium]